MVEYLPSICNLLRIILSIETVSKQSDTKPCLHQQEKNESIVSFKSCIFEFNGLLNKTKKKGVRI